MTLSDHSKPLNPVCVGGQSRGLASVIAQDLARRFWAVVIAPAVEDLVTEACRRPAPSWLRGVVHPANYLKAASRSRYVPHQGAKECTRRIAKKGNKP